MLRRTRHERIRGGRRFHQPVLPFAGASLARLPLGAARGLAVVAMTLLIVTLVAAVTETRRRPLKAAILALVARIEAMMTPHLRLAGR